MILLVNDSSLNLNIAQLLNNQRPDSSKETISYLFSNDSSLSATKDSSVTLMDLRSDGMFQEGFFGIGVAKLLLSKGLSSTVTQIDLMVSDVLKKSSLSVFAGELAQQLNALSQGKINVQVRAFYDLNYDATFIMPPSDTSQEWSIYGINFSENNPNLLLNLETLSRVDNKHLIWQGTDIREALKDKIFYGSTGCAYSSFPKSYQEEQKTSEGGYTSKMFTMSNQAFEKQKMIEEAVGLFLDPSNSDLLRKTLSNLPDKVLEEMVNSAKLKKFERDR